MSELFHIGSTFIIDVDIKVALGIMESNLLCKILKSFCHTLYNVEEFNEKRFFCCSLIFSFYIHLSHSSKQLAYLMRKIFFIWGHFRCLESWKKGKGSIMKWSGYTKRKPSLWWSLSSPIPYIHAFIDYSLSCWV